MNIEEVKQAILAIYPHTYKFSIQDGIDGIICLVPNGKGGGNYLAVTTEGKPTFTVGTRYELKEGTDLLALLSAISFPVGMPPGEGIDSWVNGV